MKKSITLTRGQVAAALLKAFPFMADVNARVRVKATDFQYAKAGHISPGQTLVGAEVEWESDEPLPGIYEEKK